MVAVKMASRALRFLRSPGGNLDLGLLVVRVGFGLSLAFNHGLGKLLNLSGFIDNVARLGFPAPWLLAPLAAFSEFFGGLLLALGLFSRVAAVSIVVTMISAAFFVHAGDPFNKRELALAFAVAALAVLLSGPGRYSLDRRFFRKH